MNKQGFSEIRPSVFYPREGSVPSRHVRGCEHHVTATPFPPRNILRGVAVGSMLFICKTLFGIEMLGRRAASPQIKPFSITLSMLSVFNLMIGSQRRSPRWSHCCSYFLLGHRC